MKILKFDTKQTVLELNEVHIEVIPSHYLDAMHSLTNPKFILREDSDYVKQIAYYEKNYSSVYDLQFLQQNMFVIPVAFSKELKNNVSTL